jgi:hypothetical protein
MSTRLFRMFRWVPAAGLASVLFGTVGTTSGCSSSDETPAAGTGDGSANGGSGNGGSSGSSGAGGGGGACASPGGPATGPADLHCEGDSGRIVQATGKCVTGAVDAGSGGGGAEETLPGPWGGTSAADDDCKYDVNYTVTPICENQDVTFTITLKSRVDQTLVKGAEPDLEVLDPNGIPAAEGNQHFTEKSDGVYEVTGIRFNKKGKWTVRFHFFETCSDTPEDSPHGHAAFFIDVP